MNRLPVLFRILKPCQTFAFIKHHPITRHDVSPSEGFYPSLSPVTLTNFEASVSILKQRLMHNCTAVWVVSHVFAVVFQLWTYSISNWPPVNPSPRMAQSRRRRKVLKYQLNGARWHRATYRADRGIMMPSTTAIVTGTRAEGRLYLNGFANGSKYGSEVVAEAITMVSALAIAALFLCTFLIRKQGSQNFD